MEWWKWAIFIAFFIVINGLGILLAVGLAYSNKYNKEIENVKKN